ncbi:hypothetical protein [Cyclobacterium roseum]|uniref:hypothetical protein n=1 Tax=Cyclobacterium roseum TaxID=2666137 RepID=UPI001F18B7A8|nr:hypothetical protein [Cyclobacterium roseum]
MREGSFYRFFVLILVFFLILTQGFAQEKDSIQSTQPTVYDFIILNGKVNNRFAFMGRDFGRKIPSANLGLMYFFNNGWYVNASVFTFLESDIPIQYALTSGYQTDLSPITDLDISYSQFLVPGESKVAGIQNMGVLQGRFGLDWNYLYSTIGVQGLFNETPDLFLTSRHSRYFEFDQKLLKVFTVSFEPSFSFTFGTSRFYYLGGYEVSDTEKNEAIENFNLLSWEIEFPLNVEWNNWMIEFQTRYIIPQNLPDFDESVSGFVFGSHLIYTIPIKKAK